MELQMKSPQSLSYFTYAILPILLLPSLSHASSIDVNFHDDTTRIIYATYTARDVVSDGGALIINQQDDSTEQVFHLGISKVSKNVRFGLRGIYTSPGDNDVLAIGLGLNAKFGLSRKTSFSVNGYYAPELTSIMDATGYSELGLRLSFNITKPLDLYLGYRNLKVEIDGRDKSVELDDDFHLGLKFYF